MELIYFGEHAPWLRPWWWYSN